MFYRGSLPQSVTDKTTHLPDELVLQSNETSSCLPWCLLWSWKERGSICPKVRQTLQHPMLNKHSQTSGHLTPATGIPLVCLDDGGLLLSIASALFWEAKEKAGHSSVLHIVSPTHIKLLCWPQIKIEKEICRHFLRITCDWRGKEGEKEKKIRPRLSVCFITCKGNEGERLRVNNCKAYPSFSCCCHLCCTLH